MRGRTEGSSTSVEDPRDTASSWGSLHITQYLMLWARYFTCCFRSSFVISYGSFLLSFSPSWNVDVFRPETRQRVHSTGTWSDTCLIRDWEKISHCFDRSTSAPSWTIFQIAPFTFGLECFDESGICVQNAQHGTRRKYISLIHATKRVESTV